MKKLLGVLAVAFAMVSMSQAHFVYVVPDTNGTTAKVIFSDNLKPDEKVNIEKIANTKLTMISDSKAKAIDMKLDKTTNCYIVEVPGEGTRVVGGTTNYGVLQRGETPAFWLMYHPKAIVGPIAGVDQPMLGEKVPLELTATVKEGKLHFQAFLKGKPLPKAELTVTPPEGESATVATDDKGMCPGTMKTGTYAVRVKYEDMTKGEETGKKFESIRHYATLIVNWSK